MQPSSLCPRSRGAPTPALPSLRRPAPTFRDGLMGSGLAAALRELDKPMRPPTLGSQGSVVAFGKLLFIMGRRPIPRWGLAPRPPFGATPRGRRSAEAAEESRGPKPGARV